jgi:hypothetical protein
LDRVLECKAPCDAEVRFTESETFTLGGQGLVESAPFTFRPRNGAVTLQVKPRTPTDQTDGVALAKAGGFALGLGAVLGLFGGFGYLVCKSESDNSCGSSSAVPIAGAVVVGIGVGMLYLGGKAARATEFTVQD